MATLNSKTIGTGGDYATPADWIAACPTNITTADASGYVYQGKLLNSFSGTSTILTISGISGCDADHYVEITTADGCSFLDNANVRTNALRYNESNGVGLRITSGGAWASAIRCTVPFTRVSKLQISNERDNTDTQPALYMDTGADNTDTNQCIIEGASGSGGASGGAYSAYGAGNKIRNSLVISRSTTTTSYIAYLGNGASAYSVTFIALGATLDNGLSGLWGTPTIKNCYVGGATNPAFTGTDAPAWSKTNCYTDVSGPPSGWSAAPLSTTTFESVTSGSHDFRLKSGSALIDAGVTDATYASTDVTGTARTGSYDVGAWEYAGTAGTDATAPGATLTGTATLTTGTASGNTTGGFTSDVMANNAGSVWANTAVVWTWWQGSIGSAPTSLTHGTGTTNASGVLTCTGLPTGAGFLIVRTTDSTNVYYQPGTVT